MLNAAGATMIVPDNSANNGEGAKVVCMAVDALAAAV